VIEITKKIKQHQEKNKLKTKKHTTHLRNVPMKTDFHGINY